MSKVLVTGIAGFIGSSIARALLHEGAQVCGIDNLCTGNMENLAEILDRIEFIQGDINDPDTVARACGGAQYVFHQAAIPSVPKSVKDPVGSNLANIDGTLSVLVAARDAKVKRVIYAASSSAYGDQPTLPKREDMPPAPISPYAVQKLAGEYYMGSFWKVYGLETVSLRYFNIFGPRQDPTSPYSGVLAKFTTQMLQGETPTIFGDGETSRDFTYIDNAVQANLKAAKANSSVAGGMFNVATGVRVTLNQAFEALRKVTGYSGGVNYAPEREGDVKHSLADISAAAAALGYSPTVSFEDGLGHTVAWYREAGVGAR
ncbi:MAG TPA: SDR family oxidoreductase [Clostridia bacterium]|nr:SDR family oxidoreductase [Clostridia bacterium]